MSARSYLSIGDVLTLLRQEFPDVTISKIRFLESQGLVNPERTPSGYRKFYEHDVERLRWVLRQQREHFLPLKVIKDRLDEDGNGGTPARSTAATASIAPTAGGGVSATADETAADASVLVAAGAASVEADPAIEAASGLPGIETAARHRAPARAGVGSAATPATAAPTVPVERAHRASLATQAAPSVARPGVDPAANGAAHGTTGSGPVSQAAPPAPATPPAPKSSKGTSRRAPAASTNPAAPSAAASGPDGGPGSSAGSAPVTGGARGSASLSLDDLCAASGLSAEGVAELQEYGLVTSTEAAGVAFFDEEALAVANLAAQFAAYGVEARHLRLYKNAADREAGFIEQIVIPMVRQRNPEARARAAQTAEELSTLGQQMKSSLLRSALHDIL